MLKIALLLLSLTILQNTKSDFMLSQFNFTQIFEERSPKLWFHHVRKYLYLKVNFSFVYQNVQYFLSQLSESSNLFKTYAFETQLLNLKSKPSTIMVFTKDSYLFYMTKASGHVLSDFYSLTCDGFEHYDPAQLATGFTMTLYFSLISEFALNITFHFVHLSTHICAFANITIFPAWNLSVENFCFCGHFSRFDVFPRFQNVHMNIQTVIDKVYYNFSLTCDSGFQGFGTLRNGHTRQSTSEILCHPECQENSLAVAVFGSSAQTVQAFSVQLEIQPV